MIARWTRVTGIFLFLLFIGGTILLPAFHEAHCADHRMTHEAATCPICQLANTPALTMTSPTALMGEAVIFAQVDIQSATPPSASLRDPTQARAPPAA